MVKAERLNCLVKLIDLGFPSGQSLSDAFDNFLGACDLTPGALYFARSAANGATPLTKSPPSLATNDASYAACGTTSFSRGATSGSSGTTLSPSCLPLFTGHVSLLRDYGIKKPPRSIRASSIKTVNASAEAIA